MSNPILIWAAAVATLVIGLRRRDDRRPRRATRNGLPGPFAVAARVPAPAWVVNRAASPKVVADIAAAGLGPLLTAERVARARAGLATIGIGLAVVGATSSPLAVVLGFGATCAGYLAPLLWLRRTAGLRRATIVRELPDLIDVVVLCTQAGMALEPALRLAATRLDGACSREIAATLAELDLGTPRRSAYRGLAERVGATELTGLVAALLQADELGMPIADALGRQAELLRASRRQAIRDHAARAAPKVQLVVAMVMVPAALLLVIGVMVIQLLGQLGAVAGGVT